MNFFMSKLLSKIGTFSTIAILFTFMAAHSAKDVYISTKRTESKLLEVAIPEFRFNGNDKNNLGVLASLIINFDLKFTGYFKPIEKYSLLKSVQDRDTRLGKIDYDEWRTLASNFLVQGVINVQADRKLTLEVKVYDLQKKKIFFAKKYIGRKKLFRQMAHQFSDDILMRLTGDKGIARTKIVFVSKVRGRKELMIMDYDGNNPRQITSDRSLVLFPSWNPKKKNLILFTTYRYRNPDIYVIDLLRRKRWPLSRKVGLNSTGEWSPDGEKVAYSLSRKGNSDIYVMNSDGTNSKKLTFSKSIETSPEWSPDGSRILYTSDRSGSPQIYVMKSDGSEKKRITYRGTYNDSAAWSSHGNLIAYASLVGNKFDVVVMNYKNPRATNLTNGQGSNESPAWAPNGRHIVYSSTKGGKSQVYIMLSDGTNKTQVTFLPGGGYLPSWGPD